MESVLHIPDHVLVIIFSYLDTLKATNNVRLVCRHWNHLILNFWSKKDKLTIDKYLENPETFSEYITALSNRHPKIKELTIEPVDRSISPNVIEKVPCHYAAIGKVFPKLEKVIFYDTLMDDKALMTIVKACPKLKNLCLFSCFEIQDKGIIQSLRLAPQLKELEIIGCPEVSSEIAVHCRNLSSLIYEECPFDNTSWTQLSDSGGKDNLEKLSTTPIKYDRLCLFSQKFPKLRQLYIAEFDDEDNLVQKNYRGFPQLEILCLTYGSVSYTENLTHILSKCPSIRVLWIWNCVNKTIGLFIDEVMGQLQDKIVHLIIDDLKAEQIDKMNLRHFIKLKKLTIIGSILSNASIQRIIDGCPNLTHLDISDSVPPSPLNIKATHEDFWLNTQPLTKRASCINIEPPFRSNYKTTGENYLGPVLEIDCDTKSPKYKYLKQS